MHLQNRSRGATEQLERASTNTSKSVSSGVTCWRTEATDDAVHEVCVDDLAAALALQQIEDRGGETLLKKREHVLSPGDERELRTTHITGD